MSFELIFIRITHTDSLQLIIGNSSCLNIAFLGLTLCPIALAVAREDGENGYILARTTHVAIAERLFGALTFTII